MLENDRPVHLKSALRSLYQFQCVEGKHVENPANFPQCQILMTFLMNPSGCSKGWGILASPKDAVPNM